MAWIKLRTDLMTDPAVYRLAALMDQDRYAIVGRLAAFWGWADLHAVDGAVDGASSQVVDDVVSLHGFAEALQAVKWLRIEADRVVIPHHDRHNGANAKERTLKSERQAKWRVKKPSEKTAKRVDGDVDGPPSTREEKIREDKKPPKAPQGALDVPDWIPAEPWSEFVAMRRAKGQRTPFTVGAAKGVVGQLAKFREAGHDLTDILRASTVNGWADVYEPKGKANGSGGSTAMGAFI